MRPNYMYVNDQKFIKQLADTINSQNGLYHGGKAIVAIIEGVPVGILSLSNNASEIISLEVLPKYRRRGIAMQLISYAKKFAHRFGRNKLSVISMNEKSNRLYSRHGKRDKHSSTFTIKL